MKKEFLSYEMALELKKLGFDEPCIAFYNGRFLDFKIWNDDGREASQINVNMDVGQCPNAPTFSQVFRWFREKYNFHSNIKCVNTVYNNHFRFEIDSNGETLACTNKIESYEKAELRCLQKLIEITKNK